ncbi:MAG: DUF4340 domain-containing protein [Bacteroidales bacterium]|nr:MAG: DUF4340 domain-containing protein [Bacteroidales bacterium]
MYKKLNIKSLVIIFAVLLIIVIIVFYLDSKKGERTFRSNIVDIDTSKVTSIIIYPKSNRQEPVEIIRKDYSWKIKSRQKLFNADENIVTNILKTMTELKPKRVAAADRSRWEEFEVTDSLATRVQLITGKKTGADIYFGKFSYQQPKNQMAYYYNQQGTINTFVRIARDKIVYVVEGYLGMTLNRGLNEFRNKSILRSNKSDWTRLSFTYPADSSFYLVREGVNWMVDGLLADSASVASYFNSISWLTSSDFVDDQKPLHTEADFTLKIEGNNFVKPIQVKAFKADTANRYLITSSLNEGAFFSGAKSKLTEKIFVGKNEFLVPVVLQ